MHRYKFWVETFDGVRLEWTHLTKSQATSMHKSTTASTPNEVRRFGWEEVESGETK
jgi:hypothetical protein